jgi:type I restriction enzyme M protein
VKERKGKIQLIDGRNFWVPMKKSLGNKRRKIGDAKSKRTEDKNDPDNIGDLTRIYYACKDGATRKLKIGGEDKKLVVSKVFDNEDFGFHKITVERPLRLNFQASEERIALLEEQSAFKSLATSKMKNDKPRLAEIAAGKKRQQVIRDLLIALSKETKDRLFKDRELFLTALKKVDASRKVRLSTAELKVILNALGERDESDEICLDRSGAPEPDSDLRDTEIVPLKEDIQAYFKREVLPHVPDAWIDESKTKVGYEIPLNRHFYRYEPPRPLEAIEADIKQLEGEILDLLKDVTA